MIVTPESVSNFMNKYNDSKKTYEDYLYALYSIKRLLDYSDSYRIHVLISKALDRLEKIDIKLNRRIEEEIRIKFRKESDDD